ncbi:MAG: DUF819 family protein [Bacteroidales bacterium]|nr:DUF819 family protein [Bacteroidales bacterium]
MAAAIITILFFILAPAGVMWLCRRFKVLGAIGPILILYFIGIVSGNIVRFPSLPSIQETMTNVTIPLAIPLMLFSFSFRKNSTRGQILALVTGIAAVVAAVISGYFIFGRNMEDGAKVAGMLTGVYTGGTINLASLKTMLDAGEEMFILLNGGDVVVSFLYLAFLLAVGIRLFRKMLPVNTPSDLSSDESFSAMDSSLGGKPFAGILSRRGLGDAGLQVLVALAIVGVSAGLGLLAGDGAFMVVFILSLTTFGIAASFIPKVHDGKYGYDMGMYLIYIFCIVVASMADFSKIDLSGGLNAVGYLALVIFGSLLIQLLLARIFRIDADTVVVSSVAFICSPPFVPMISAAMKNRSVLAPGLAIGVVGYAVGNYLGYLIFTILN